MSQELDQPIKNVIEKALDQPTKLQLIAAALREQEQVPFRVDVAFGGTCYFVLGPGGRQFGDPFTCESDAQELAKLLNEVFGLGVVSEQLKVNASSDPPREAE